MAGRRLARTEIMAAMRMRQAMAADAAGGGDDLRSKFPLRSHDLACARGKPA
jgi:hypothetical protein